MFNPDKPFVFGKDFFQVHQIKLLKFANSWIGRYILKINGNKSSVGKYKIRKIEPNAIWWTAGRYRKVEFRTHNKYSKRLYYAFYPVWWLMHQWDTLFANNFEPAWNLGFDTLTVYPDAHTESTSVDGYVGRIQFGTESFSTLRSGNGTDVNDTGTSLYCGLFSHTDSNNWRHIFRAITLFDTSALTSSASISSTTLSVNSTGGGASYKNFSQSINITSSDPASNTALATGDYAIAKFGSTKFSDTSIAIATFNDSGWRDFAFNASGISAISKTGVSKFSYRYTGDIDNSAPTWASNTEAYSPCYSADQTGTTSDPKLVVTYTTFTAYTKDFTENIVVSDSIVKAITRDITDGTIVLSDSIVKAITRAFNEGEIVLSEAYSTVRGYFKTFTESDIVLSDNYSTVNGKGLEFNDGIELTDVPFNHVAESYDETNENGWFILGEYGKIAVGSPFVVGGGSGYAHKVTLYLKKTGSPTGNANLILCTLNGSDRPQTTLATSDTVLDVSTLTTSYELFDFEFLGSNQPFLTGGTKYGWYIVYTNGDASNNLNVGSDSTNGYSLTSYESTDLSSWSIAVGDMIFYVYTNNSFFSKAITTIKSEAVSLTDSINKAITVVKEEVLNITDNIAKAFTTIKGDGIDISESFSKVVGYLRTYSDDMGITDALSNARQKVFSEAVSLTDSIVRTLNGLLVTLWTKIAKEASSIWTKVSKEASSVWTKQERPET